MEKVRMVVEGRRVVKEFNEHFRFLTRLNETMIRTVLQHYREYGLTYVDVPAIVGITGACENIDTLFRVGSRVKVPLFFAQTGQLALEQALQTLPGVCTIIHSGRDEETEDQRHLRQFRLIEEEFDCTLVGMTRQNYDEEKMYEALLNHIEQAVKSMIRATVTGHGKELIAYGRNTAKLRQVLTKPFLRISYSDAIDLLQKNGFPYLKFGDDLRSAEEARVVELLNDGDERPVFIMRYPKEIKFFNMKTSTKDQKLALSADLIFPYAGEAVGSAVREHDFTRLNDRLKTSKMFQLHLERGGKYEDFLWYLNIIKRKRTQPHAGYGIGCDRILQFIFGTNDIRSTSVFSLLNTQTKDWEIKQPDEQPAVFKTG